MVQKRTAKHNANTPTTIRSSPRSEEIEKAILGALLLEKDALTAVIDMLHPKSFYKTEHQEIYKAIVDLFNNSQSIDIQTVVTQLKKNGALENIGGISYITQLTNSISSAANIEFHARIIIEYAIRRDLISVATEIQSNAYEDTVDVLSLLDHSEQILFEVGEANIRKNYSDIGSLMSEAFKELNAKKNLENGLIGIPSGFTELDKITMGWQKSELVIIAARPGMGKTAFLLSALRNAAVNHSYPVAIFSLEMSGIQLVNRLISIESELESEKIKKGKLEDYEWEQLLHKTTNLSNAPIYIDDTPALSIFELRAKCRRLKAKHDIQLIAIDYLQLMSGSVNKYGPGNREQEIASISRALKSIAKELDISVIAASQLSRAVETRGGDKRPMLSDLRESGSIEQDSDMVIFLYRPEYYNITEDTEGNSTSGISEVIIAKHRNGSIGTSMLRYIGKYVKFDNLSHYHTNNILVTSKDI